MISTTSFKIKEKLNDIELNILQSKVTNILKDILPEKIFNIHNQKVDLEFNMENQESIFSIGCDKEYCEVFEFINEEGDYETKHFNESYSFVINSFLICLKSIAPKKIEIYKGKQNWEESVLFANQVLKNTNFCFFDVEYIELEDDIVLHISKNEEEACYLNKKEENIQDFEEFEEDVETEDEYFSGFNDDLTRN